LAEKHGERFLPPQIIVDKAKAGEKFYAWCINQIVKKAEAIASAFFLWFHQSRRDEMIVALTYARLTKPRMGDMNPRGNHTFRMPPLRGFKQSLWNGIYSYHPFGVLALLCKLVLLESFHPFGVSTRRYQLARIIAPLRGPICKIWNKHAQSFLQAMPIPKGWNDCSRNMHKADRTPKGWHNSKPCFSYVTPSGFQLNIPQSIPTIIAPLRGSAPIIWPHPTTIISPIRGFWKRGKLVLLQSLHPFGVRDAEKPNQP
jgi:hypothetical protein